jgi:hypothetical protein
MATICTKSLASPPTHKPIYKRDAQAPLQRGIKHTCAKKDATKKDIKCRPWTVVNLRDAIVYREPSGVYITLAIMVRKVSAALSELCSSAGSWCGTPGSLRIKVSRRIFSSEKKRPQALYAIPTTKHANPKPTAQTFSVNFELLDPSADCNDLPSVLRGFSGFGLCGGLRCVVCLGNGAGSSKGFESSSGWRITGVRAGLGRMFILPAPITGDPPMSLPISFGDPGPL